MSSHHDNLEGENKHARYSSSGGLSRWLKRNFKEGSSNRSRGTFAEREESHVPLRVDHEHDHDDDHEGQDGDEDVGEEYEMIERNNRHESES